MTKDQELLLIRTQNFIRDYDEWNRAANESRDKDGTVDYEKAETEYAALVARYAVPGIAHKNIAFGTHSAHDPDNEYVLDISIDGADAVVFTRHFGPFNTTSDFEYVYRKTDIGWRLVDLIYVADNYRGTIL